jgi:protein-tyrosine phosphatase
MKYGIFLILGIIFGLQAALLRGPYWLLVWPCLSFGLVGFAYLGLGPRIFGKRPTGTMAWYSVLVLLPYLLLTWLTWYLVRHLSSEDCCNEAAPGIFIGRRPLAAEVPDGVTMIVDLTAEFREQYGVRNGLQYIAAPMLDAGTTTEIAFKSLVRRIANWDGPVYIHCAQGHGRTGMVAAAVLVTKGLCTTIEEAVLRLRTVRPRLDLGRDQLAFVRRICTHINS